MAEYFYYRDHENGAWGVARANNPQSVAGDPLVTGLDKSIAASVASLLNGKVGTARSLLARLPDCMPPESSHRR